MPLPPCFEVAFWSFAGVVTAFLGWFCFEIHDLNRAEYRGSKLAQQVWLNVVGALAGWVALWFLVLRWWGVRGLSAASVQLTASDFVLALTAFIGVTGYLPYLVVGFVYSSVALLRSLFQHALQWLGKTG
jgi:hypothetical protein